MSKGLKKEDSMALKGIAVLMLVFHHCYRTAAKFEQYDVVFCGLSASQVITAAEICKICVAIFAFVSGYGLMYGYTIDKKKRNTRSISAWTLRHILSVMSGFWFVSVIFYGIYICLARNGFYKWGENAVEKCFCILADVCGVSSFLGTKSLNGAWWYMSAAVTFSAVSCTGCGDGAFRGAELPWNDISSAKDYRQRISGRIFAVFFSDDLCSWDGMLQT